jgi:hypothetical protein
MENITDQTLFWGRALLSTVIFTFIHSFTDQTRPASQRSARPQRVALFMFLPVDSYDNVIVLLDGALVR